DVSETVPSSFYAVGPTTCPAVVSGGSPPPTCSFTDKKRGQILITKNTYGGDGSFTFTLTGGPENVSQTATITTTAFVGTTSFTGLAPGLYSVSESVPGSFYPAGATQCSATVESGGTTMCTFTNDLRGSVVVTKNTVGGTGSFTFPLAGGPESVSATATISTSGTTMSASGTATFGGLTPGATYTVSEGANASFTPSGFTTCVAVIPAGGSFPCSFTNNANGSVVVTKNTTGGNGSFTFVLSNSVTMSATVTTTNNTGSTTFSALAPGTFTLSEIVDSGFVFASATCSAGVLPPPPPPLGPSGSGPITLTVSAGMQTDCSFTNNARGQIVVTKNTTGGNGSFTFTLRSGTMTATATISTVAGSGTVTFSGVAPGTFTVSEGVNASFAPMGSTTCSVNVPPGGTATCSFTNVKKNEGFMTGGGQIKTDDKSEANFGGNARGTA